MNRDPMESCKNRQPLQFTLRGWFVLLTIFCVYMALSNAIGVFYSALLLGLLVMSAVVVLLRIENLLLGSVLGAALAIGILAALLFTLPAQPSTGAVVACIIYPPVGSAIGLVCAADRLLRAG